jgi:hypothetical protein
MEMRSITTAGFLCAAIGLAFPNVSEAASLRCPNANFGAPATAVEAQLIDSLWRDIGGSGTQGGDGPLGCPRGAVVDLPGNILKNASQWTGIGQHFQRGWILIGRGASAGKDAVLVRGLNSWTIWTQGLTGTLTTDLKSVSGSSPIQPVFSATSAAWPRGGRVQIAVGTFEVTMYQCEPLPPNELAKKVQVQIAKGVSPENVSVGLSCTAAFPTVWSDERPLDPAARLSLDRLTTPDPGGFDARLGALFPDWLACFTLPPGASGYPGEDQLTRALVMMRRSTPCPLTAQAPSSLVQGWLRTLEFEPGQLPGTSSEDESCPRKGELDVALVGLMHLASQYRSSLDAATVDRIRTIVKPYGGVPRAGPYITFDATCFGYSILESENHILLEESARHVINGFLADQNLGSNYNNVANGDWLKRFLQQIVRRDFYEFNALPYQRYQLKALFLLHDHAPDATVRTAARGALHWVFAKQALSANLTRDHRPYRRLYEPARITNADWFGPARTTSSTHSVLLVGPVNRLHGDLDLQLNAGKDDQGKDILSDVTLYALVATGSESVVTDLADMADTTYRLPAAIASWFAQRFNDDTANRLMYVQAINHVSAVAEDPKLFLQSNTGAEIVSGNRNWNIVAGGTPTPPSVPVAPPQSTGSAVGYALLGAAGGAAVGAVIGGAIGGFVGAGIGAVIGAVGGFIGGIFGPDEIAKDTQRDVLWDTQAGTLRETTLIPSAVGLDRAQTLRFDVPLQAEKGVTQLDRLCVGAGFMCGYNLRMPTRAFSAKDQAACPLSVQLPAALNTFYNRTLANGKPMSIALGCKVKADGEANGWTVYTFERGMMVIVNSDPAGSERVGVIWLEVADNQDRTVHVAWKLPGSGHDWFRVHAYNRPVQPAKDEPPEGSFEFQMSGDANNTNKFDNGEVTFKVAPGTQDTSWDFLVVACDPTYFIVRTGHECHSNHLPTLSVNVAPEPMQAFSCAADTYRDPTKLILSVGESCSKSPYGFFVYIWTSPCRREDPCPPGASDYGFAVVAPSRGWTWQEFADRVYISTLPPSANYNLRADASVNVPISPPVKLESDSWKAIGVPTDRVVQFRWPRVDTASVFVDPNLTSLYAALSSPPSKWPTATGQLFAPDATTATTRLLSSSGSACFTLAGLPTSAQPDPVSLVVDMRNVTSPSISEPNASALATACT